MSPISQQGYARNIAAFLSFLTSARSGISWRDANEDDHVAYLVWRRRDASGPRVSGATWNREVAAVNNFYRWQCARDSSPRTRSRTMPVVVALIPRAASTIKEVGPTTYSRDVNRDNIEWIPQASYRRWRDTGMKGMNADGLPRPAFRGRWATRNAVFCDLMVRTGLRLAEQSALTVFDLPTEHQPVSYQRFRLPVAIAKGSSTRWVYIPESIVRELINYRDVDRRPDYRRRSRTRTVRQNRSPARRRGPCPTYRCRLHERRRQGTRKGLQSGPHRPAPPIHRR